MTIGFGERIELENDAAFSNTARLLALGYALDIYTGKITVAEKEKQLATHILKGCASNTLVPEMNKLIIARIEEIFPKIQTKQELIAGLYSGELIETLNASIKKNWTVFANLFSPTAPVATTPTATTTTALKL